MNKQIVKEEGCLYVLGIKKCVCVCWILDEPACMHFAHKLVNTRHTLLTLIRALIRSLDGAQAMQLNDFRIELHKFLGCLNTVQMETI